MLDKWGCESHCSIPHSYFRSNGIEWVRVWDSIQLLTILYRYNTCHIGHTSANPGSREKHSQIPSVSKNRAISPSYGVSLMWGILHIQPVERVLVICALRTRSRPLRIGKRTKWSLAWLIILLPIDLKFAVHEHECPSMRIACSAFCGQSYCDQNKLLSQKSVHSIYTFSWKSTGKQKKKKLVKKKSWISKGIKIPKNSIGIGSNRENRLLRSDLLIVTFKA